MPHTHKVLIVDDDITTQMILRRLLNGVGEICCTNNGEEALTLIRGAPPDIILLDADMPGADGFTICTELKLDQALAEVPIIFITARSDEKSEAHAFKVGAVDFIQKPISAPVVRARVETHLALKQKTDELRRLSTTDMLTGIANRRAFDEALDVEWRRACRAKTPLTLMMVDVDYFKRYNDFYGHVAGDECIRQVALTLASSVQRPADLVARYGGEEFAILLPETAPDQAEVLANKLITRIRALEIPHAKSDVRSCVSVSVGLSGKPMSCRSANTTDSLCPVSAQAESCHTLRQSLVRAADQALYAAKLAGRDQFHRLPCLF